MFHCYKIKQQEHFKMYLFHETWYCIIKQLMSIESKKFNDI